MRQNWEIKKLGEISDFQGGSQPPKGEWISEPKNGYVRMLQIRDFTQSNSLNIEYVKKSNRLKYCKEDDILIGRYGASVGKILTGLSGAYNVAIIKTIPNETLINRNFFRHFLSAHSFQDFLQHVSKMRAAQAGFSKEDIQDYRIPIPPLSEQERIVAELDLLSDVIAKKREQLKQLDALAQSIFYDMFGDPITNEKGWETKKLGEISTLHNGRAFKPTDWGNSGLPIVRIQNLNNPTLPFNYYNGEVTNSYRLYGGELLYAWSGTPDTSFGAHIWHGGDAVLNQHIFKIEYNKDLLNIKYFVFNLNGIVNSMFDKTHGGVGLQHITKGTLTSQNICLPPLYLQQQFASMIESIEKQKELIKQSLSEVQQLFDSRMDYYFG